MGRLATKIDSSDSRTASAFGCGLHGTGIVLPKNWTFAGGLI